jgi:hypothetical protein
MEGHCSGSVDQNYRPKIYKIPSLIRDLVSKGLDTYEIIAKVSKFLEDEGCSIEQTKTINQLLIELIRREIEIEKIIKQKIEKPKIKKKKFYCF